MLAGLAVKIHEGRYVSRDRKGRMGTPVDERGNGDPLVVGGVAFTSNESDLI